VDLDQNYEKLLKTFSYRGLQDKNIFYDENHLRFPANYHDKFARLAQAYLDAGQPVKAREVATKCLELMPDAAVPFDVYTPLLAPALAAGGDKARANQILDLLTSRSEQMLAYYSTRPDGSLFDDDQRGYLVTLQSVYRAAEIIGDKSRAQRAATLMNSIIRSSKGLSPLLANATRPARAVRAGLVVYTVYVQWGRIRVCLNK
jgi:hypothetical protein